MDCKDRIGAFKDVPHCPPCVAEKIPPATSLPEPARPTLRTDLNSPVPLGISRQTLKRQEKGASCKGGAIGEYQKEQQCLVEKRFTRSEARCYLRSKSFEKEWGSDSSDPDALLT